VGTGGNAQATSLGVKFNASHNWTRTYFTVLGGGVRADSTTIERFAFGPSESDDGGDQGQAEDRLGREFGRHVEA
jgi:hypothetical protein